MITIPVGLVEYAKAYALQKRLVEAKRRDPSQPDYCLLVEHPDVYTWGRKSQETLPFLLPAVREKSVFLERGGEGTFHNPGQMVAYPIVRFAPEDRDIHRFLRNLEGALIEVLAGYGLACERRDGETGVWMVGERKKIASIGIAVSGWVSYHGVALNVSNDLHGFSLIRPCGYEANVMTSMQERLGTAPPLAEVGLRFAECFALKLGRTVATSDDAVLAAVRRDIAAMTCDDLPHAGIVAH